MYSLYTTYVNMCTKFRSHSTIGKGFTICINLYFVEIDPRNTIDHNILKSKEQNKSYSAVNMLKRYVHTFSNRDPQSLDS